MEGLFCQLIADEEQLAQQNHNIAIYLIANMVVESVVEAFELEYKDIVLNNLATKYFGCKFRSKFRRKSDHKHKTPKLSNAN